MTYPSEVAATTAEEVWPKPLYIYNKHFTKKIGLTSTLDSSFKNRKRTTFFGPVDQYMEFCNNFKKLSKKSAKEVKDNKVFLAGKMELVNLEFDTSSSSIETCLITRLLEKVGNVFKRRRKYGHSFCNCSEEKIERLRQYYKKFEKFDTPNS